MQWKIWLPNSLKKTMFMCLLPSKGDTSNFIYKFTFIFIDILLNILDILIVK